MALPFLSAATVERVKGLRARGFATRLALADPPISLVLTRWHDDGTSTVLPAQTVILEYAGREPAEPGGEVDLTFTEGVLLKAPPFDAKPGDTFTLPNGQSGHVTSVPLAQDGIARAAFTITTGAA